MWVNGELRLSDEQLMTLWDLIGLAIDVLDTESNDAHKGNEQVDPELVRKANSAIDLQGIIETELMERLDRSWH
jgi:hypothetical protein